MKNEINLEYNKKSSNSKQKSHKKKVLIKIKINGNSTSITKSISPITCYINNNLINTEKINKNKYDYLGNKKDFKKKNVIQYLNSNTSKIVKLLLIKII